MDSSLRVKSLTRVPGTGVFKFPFRDVDGKYRTGLDVDATYIKRIQDKTEREIEIKRVKDTKARLEDMLGLDLGPRSNFWNYALSRNEDDQTHVKPVKLRSPFQELTFSWLRVHPTIASSFQAWERGEYPAETQFFVADDEIENSRVFKKKQLINKAIVKFDNMSPEKKKKVARLLGLPVTEETKEELVYNLVDNLLKEGDFRKGPNQGLSTVAVFNKFADMKENILHIKDVVRQAVAHSIYRVRPDGAVYEGEFEVAKSEEDLVKFLVDDDNQSDLLTLEGKLKIKKIASV
jgi:hypothetical protein